MIKRTLLTLAFGMAALNTISIPTHAQDMEAALQAVEDALPGELLHNPFLIDWETKGDKARFKVIDAETPTGQAIQARNKKRRTKAWDVALWVDLPEGVKKGDTVEMHFWARTEKAATGKETSEFVAFVGRNEEPYDYIISEDMTPGTEWKLHTLKGNAKADFGNEKLKVEFQLAQHAQTIEFGPIYVSNLGQTP